MEHLSQETLCPFCGPIADRSVLIESATVFAIYDKFPVSPGHALIIPKRHVSGYFELTQAEQLACWALVNQLKVHIDAEFQPAGYNIGINVGETAGQTVMHVHLHLIPRYLNDVANPRGGVRGVIPAKQSY